VRNQRKKVFRVFGHNQLKGEGKMKKIGLIISGLFVSSLLFLACGSLPSSTVGGPGKVLGPPGGEADNQKVVTFYVIGKGLEPENALSKGEAVLMAERAAVADGYRQLVEKLRGVYLEAFMRAGRGTVDQETIQVQTQSWLRGTEIMEITQGEYGITMARMSLRINFTRDGMIWWPVGIGRDVKPSFSEGTINGGGSS
jgi:hypothetical protein